MKTILTLILFSTAFLAAQSNLDQEIEERRHEIDQIIKKKTLKMQPKAIETPNFERDVTQISNEITRLWHEVDEITAHTQVQVQELYKFASIHSSIDVRGILPQPTRIYSLVATINGLRVFVIDPREHSVNYDRDIPLYFGPIHKGDHRIQIDAVILNQDKSFRQVRLDRVFHVSEGENKLEIIIE